MSLFRSAATVSSFTLLSRISGLARDVLVARAFGAGPITDAFWVAFRIPNLLRRLFAEGAFAQAFVPILGAARNNRSDDEVRTLLDRVALLLTLALMLVTLVGIVAAPWVVSAMASGLRGAARDAEFARRGLDDAGDVSVHPVHVADRLRVRRAEHLAALRRAGLHAGAAEPVHDRRLPVAGAAHGRAGTTVLPSASWPAAWRWPCNGWRWRDWA